jgi:serine/threonine protein kinase
MAPEVFEERYSTKADIWSVGCVAVQMITGNPPWKDLGLSNPVSLFQHITKSTGPPKMKINETESIYGLHNGQSTMELFKDLVNVCFDRIPENRPSSSDLLVHTFFTDEHSFSVDDANEHVNGLFNSPVSAMKHTISSSPVWANNLSPIHCIPIRRCNSIGSGIARSPMMSPPIPKRNVDSRNELQLHMEQSPTLASLSSPIPNQTEWPTWARDKLQTEHPTKEEENYNRNELITTTPVDRKSESTVDSLAYSDDDNNSNVSHTMQSDDRQSVSIPLIDEVSIFSPPLIGVNIINSNNNDV